MLGIMVYGQCFLHALSVIANLFGIHCLRRRRKDQGACHRNNGYILLMQNLALAELFKMAYEVVPLLVFHAHQDS